MSKHDAEVAIADAAFRATEDLMLNRPCVCGGEHLPATDCYLPEWLKDALAELRAVIQACDDED
jgi:hypothetical protein